MSLLLDPSIKIGSILQFSYPLVNRVRVSTKLVHRRFVVQRIRDLEKRPLSPITLRRNPDLRRGPILLRGQDLDKYEWRSFYITSARSIRTLSIPLQQLAFYDPSKPDSELDWVGPMWTDSQLDQQRIRDLIRYFNRFIAHRRNVLTCLGIFPVEFNSYGNPRACSQTTGPRKPSTLLR